MNIRSSSLIISNKIELYSENDHISIDLMLFKAAFVNHFLCFFQSFSSHFEFVKLKNRQINLVHPKESREKNNLTSLKSHELFKYL